MLGQKDNSPQISKSYTDYTDNHTDYISSHTKFKVEIRNKS